MSRPTSRRCRLWRARWAARPRRVPQRSVGPVVGALRAAPARRLRRGGRRQGQEPAAARRVPPLPSRPLRRAAPHRLERGGARRRRRRQPRFVAPLPAQLDAAAICPACAEQRLVACELCAAAVCARPGCARRGRATDDAAAGVGNDGDVQWLLPAAFARGGRAYACARCVAKCPRADDAADGAAAAAAAGTFALRRCPRGCGSSSSPNGCTSTSLRAARRRPSRRRPCAASGRRASGRPTACRPPACPAMV